MRNLFVGERERNDRLMAAMYFVGLVACGLGFEAL